MPAIMQSADKALRVLNFVLTQDFWIGTSRARIAEALGLSASDISRYLETLKVNEFIEEIPESGHVRASHRLARHAVRILNHIDLAQARLDATRSRITQEQ